MTTTTAADVRHLLGRAEYLAAFDAAEAALVDAPGDLLLRYLAVLALARAGATDTAEDHLRTSGLLEHEDPLDPALAEDVRALSARIAKDRSLSTRLDGRAELAAVAAAKYEQVFDRYHRTYSGVNAATMWCVAGELERSQRLAREVLTLLDASDANRDYWTTATRAEALLLLGDLAGASAALADASGMDGDLAARASTRRQLALVCEVLCLDVRILDALPVPVVIHYCGHLPADVDGGFRLRGPDERRAAADVSTFIGRLGGVIAYGSLAAGGDIIVAEAVLESGGELHVTLPFPSEDFEKSSVAQAGDEWVLRYRRCLERATTVAVVTGRRLDDDDDIAYSYCSSIAMGSAVIRAQFLASSAEQLAVWDGQPSDTEGGTAADVRRWSATGLPRNVIPVRAIERRNADEPQMRPQRAVRALLFADVQGFSTLRDPQICAFVAHVLQPLSDVLDRNGVLHRNGWGDALYIVVDHVTEAARLALELQDAMEAVDFASVGLPSMRLRIGMHAGPVYVLIDPVRDEFSYFGEHVTQAARIEPVAPPGAVFVTSAFAALAALEQPDAFACEYVGVLHAAKKFGSMPMHVLRRRQASPTGDTGLPTNGDDATRSRPAAWFDDLTAALRRVELFADMSARELRSLAALCRRETVAAGTTMVAGGESSSRFYLIHSGEVDVVVNGECVGGMGANDYFGEIGVIDRGDRSATIVAVTDVAFSSIASFNLRSLLREHPDITEKLLLRLCSRLRRAERADPAPAPR